MWKPRVTQEWHLYVMHVTSSKPLKSEWNKKHANRSQKKVLVITEISGTPMTRIKEVLWIRTGICDDFYEAPKNIVLRSKADKVGCLENCGKTLNNLSIFCEGLSTSLDLALLNGRGSPLAPLKRQHFYPRGALHFYSPAYFEVCHSNMYSGGRGEAVTSIGTFDIFP